MRLAEYPRPLRALVTLKGVLFAAILVILGTQDLMSDATFKAWGWRVPFLISLLLVIISLYIRLQMKESPIFAQIKTSGMTSGWFSRT